MRLFLFKVIRSNQSKTIKSPVKLRLLWIANQVRFSHPLLEIRSPASLDKSRFAGFFVCKKI